MIAGVVLAGGLSSRMGCDKSQLEISGVSLIEHSKDVLKKAGLNNIFISGHQGIKDKIKNKGPLVGILSSLEHLNNYQHILFTTVDMPLINEEIYLQLIEYKNTPAVYIENFFFPLLIDNSTTNRNIISSLIDNNQLSIGNMLKSLKATAIKSHFEQMLFANANTKADWKVILDFIEQKK